MRLWGNMIGTVVRVANEHDRLWRQRRRVLNTLLVTLFVFRLVFSKDRQGYATTVAELWEQCRMMGIALPQATPVAASAMCRARAKLDEGLFRRLHGEILREAGAADGGKRWKGRRIFAVDGSKLNLPRQLRANGYRTPSAQAWYPQGLLSCLYQLRAKMPVDFDLHAHGNERAAALGHLPALSEGDVVVYDRGYYSYETAARACGAGPASGVPVEGEGRQRLRRVPCRRLRRQRGRDCAGLGHLARLARQIPGRPLRAAPPAADQVHRRGHPLRAGDDAARCGDNPHRRPRDPLPWKMGHRGAVQDQQGRPERRGLPRPKRASGETGTVRALSS